MPPRRPLTQGFTLIELITVIVILGVLAAAALPRFLAMGREARIAALQGMSAALSSAANIGRARCAAASTCGLDQPGWNLPYYREGTQVIWTHRGWPSGWGKMWVDDWAGSIDSLINRSTDFERMPHVGGSFAGTFQLKSAPNPATCKITYQLDPWSDAITYVIDSTGC